MENNDNLITIYDNGKEILCEIVFTHHCDETNKDYIALIPLDNEEDAEEDMVYFFSYTVDENNEGQLNDLESDEEFEMLNDLLNDYMENLSSEEDEEE